MVVYNAGSKELTAKIVYYGPGLGGKTTNLQFLHRRLEPSSVGNLLTLAATADRTIFFDLLPVELGDLKGYRIRFQVATVPGQSPYNETRRVVLRGVDGVVFVVDSRWSMLPKNLESFQNLKDNLKEEGIAFESIPVVVQFNKRDLPDVLAVDALQEGLGLASLPYIEAVASDGRGVVETFKLISKLTFVDILRRLQKKGPPRPGRAATEGAPPASVETPEPAAIASAEDDSATRAIPIPADFARPKPEAPRTNLESPFFVPDDTNPALRIVPERRDAIIQETFAPFPELPPPLREDTNPSFYPSELKPAAQGAATPATQGATTTAAFPVFAPEPPVASEPAEREITAPMEVFDPEALEPAIELPETAELPALEPPPISEPLGWEDDLSPASPPAPAPAVPEPVEFAEPVAPAAPALTDPRIGELAEALARIERRLSDMGEILPRIDTIEARIVKNEEHLSREGEIAPRLETLEARVAKVESSRPWMKDVDDLRTSAANQKLEHETAAAGARAAVDRLQREVADASSREMELVAQISRESLGVAASLEKLGFRIRETEEKFSQLAVDQESRLRRLERLFEETAERDLLHQESQRRGVLELQEALQAARAETQERLAGMESLRETLSSTLGDLAERLRRAVGASGRG